MAAVGVEGTINEVWADAAEPDTDQLSPLPIADRAKLRGLWPKKERKETWWKYNRVLRELGKQEFSPEEPRSQVRIPERLERSFQKHLNTDSKTT
jgi:hypothetical protein